MSMIDDKPPMHKYQNGKLVRVGFPSLNCPWFS
jgi:hypothetical protein